jgi:hypothetical protein
MKRSFTSSRRLENLKICQNLRQTPSIGCQRKFVIQLHAVGNIRIKASLRVHILAPLVAEGSRGLAVLYARDTASRNPSRAILRFFISTNGTPFTWTRFPAVIAFGKKY